jgi:hypothetical protein
VNDSLEQLVSRSKEAILLTWKGLVVDTYPPETASFIKRESDPFLNPVGRALAEAGELLLRIAVSGAERREVEQGLGDIVRIRAVQDLSPSQALSFVEEMKKTVWKAIVAAVVENSLARDWRAVESRFDEAMLIAFDLYVDCAKRIGEIRIKEAKAEKERLLRLIRAMNRGSDPFAVGGMN